MAALRLITVSLLLAGPAAAQNGAMWVDGYGRMMSIQFAGDQGAVPSPLDRTPAAMASLFKQLCLDSGGDPARPGAAAALAELGLEAQPFTVPGGKKAGPVVLNVLRGPGVVVSQTGGFFATKVSQCNATFYVDSLPAREAMAAAMTEAVAAPPSNGASATSKNGKPNSRYTPEWSTTIGGVPHVIAAMIGTGSQSMPGNRVQIAVRAVRKAK